MVTNLSSFPGFTDLQVNGANGINLQNGDITTEALLELAEYEWSNGVTMFVPTLMTKPYKTTLQWVKEIVKARKENELLASSIPAVFLEGPCISREDGPRGAHKKELVGSFYWEDLQEIIEAAGKLKIIFNVAPELPDAIELIEKATAAGIIVTIGHTAASNEQIDMAVKAGAKLSVHLGNGNYASLPRNDNNITYQLGLDTLPASFIVDGHHLKPYVVKAYLKVKGSSRFTLVSDSIFVAGLPPGTYELDGQPIEKHENGKVTLSGTPYLAGSSINLREAVENVVAFTNIARHCAVEMASSLPRNIAGIRPQQDTKASFSWQDNSLIILQTIINGQIVYKNDYE
jgi:N-acetylglucosamine-6-phosphate deacetylase